MASSSCCACGSVTPERSSRNDVEEVIAAVLQHFLRWAAGAARCLCHVGPIDSGKRNAAGMTPTTVCGLPPIFTALAHDVRVGVEALAP